MVILLLLFNYNEVQAIFLWSRNLDRASSLEKLLLIKLNFYLTIKI